MIFFPLFPSCSQRVLSSQCVPNYISNMSPIALGFYPIWFAQSSTPLYINKNGKSRGGHLLYFATRVQRGASIGGMHNVPIKLLTSQSVWWTFKFLKKMLWVHP
jgi:hypothetical protein